jgi:hypothetical protein
MTAHTDSLPGPAEVPPAAQRRARVFGWWFYVVVAVVAPFALILAAAAAVYLWWKLAEAKAAHEVDLEVARIQALGEPVTIYDLYQYHRVPEGATDTTAKWITALKQVNGVQVNPNFLSLPIVGTSAKEAAPLAADAPDSQLAKAEQFLALCQPGLQAAHDAAAMNGECRLPQAFELGVAKLGVIQQCRGLARVLSLQTRVRQERGDTDGAIESNTTMLGLTRAMENELSLVDQLVHIAILGIALKDIQFLLEKAELTEDQLATLQAEVQAVNLQRSFTQSLVGERGVGFHSFHQFPPLVPPATPTATKADPMAGGKLTRARACLIQLQVMQELIDASRQPMPQALDAAQQVDQRVAQAMQSTNPLERTNYVLAQQFLPAGQAAFQARARIEAWQGLTLTAIAAERYRLKHDSLPADLAALQEFLPAIPLDPHDGQPLRLKVEGDELLIYSVGKDQRDDGGSDVDDRGEPDIVVRVK